MADEHKALAPPRALFLLCFWRHGGADYKSSLPGRSGNQRGFGSGESNCRIGSAKARQQGGPLRDVSGRSRDFDAAVTYVQPSRPWQVGSDSGDWAFALAGALPRADRADLGGQRRE